MPTHKILMIVAPRDFRDEEYFVPKGIWEKANWRVETASSTLGIAYGKQGGQATVDFLIEQVEVKDYRAIVLVGGPGARSYLKDLNLHRLLKQAAAAGIVLAAICIAPLVFASAGILLGKKATVWSSPDDQTAVKALEERGARYLDQSVVVDGRLVTANGPAAARAFAEAVLNLF